MASYLLIMGIPKNVGIPIPVRPNRDRMSTLTKTSVTLLFWPPTTASVICSLRHALSQRNGVIFFFSLAKTHIFVSLKQIRASVSPVSYMYHKRHSAFARINWFIFSFRLWLRRLQEVCQPSGGGLRWADVQAKGRQQKESGGWRLGPDLVRPRLAWTKIHPADASTHINKCW